LKQIILKGFGNEKTKHNFFQPAEGENIYTINMRITKMKYVLFIVIPILLISCKDELTSSKERLFSPEDIDALSLEDINDFGQGDSIWQDDYNFFKDFDGYLDGIEYISQYYKFISVHVFVSKGAALNAIEGYRSLISMMTVESGNHETFKERWWHGVSSPYLIIFVNKLNTVVFVSNTESTDENICINAAVEILNRIESKSK
jgi:hypothetical protein